MGGGGGRQNDGGCGPVVCGKPQQPTYFNSNIAAENTPVGVAFINNYIGEIAEETQPTFMLPQDGEVQHVWVGENEATVVADPGACFGGGVAIVLGGEESRSRWLTVGSVAMCAAPSRNSVKARSWSAPSAFVGER